MQVRQQVAPLVQETGMQVQTFHSFGFHLFATSRKAPRLFATVLLMGCVALTGVTSQTALAQQLDTPPAVRDTFSINSGYFSKDYASFQFLFMRMLNAVSKFAQSMVLPLTFTKASQPPKFL